MDYLTLWNEVSYYRNCFYGRSIEVHLLMHEAEFYGITPLGNILHSFSWCYPCVYERKWRFSVCVPPQWESCSCVMSWIAPPVGTCCLMDTCRLQVQNTPWRIPMPGQHLSVMKTCLCVTVYPVKRRNRHSVAGPQFMGSRSAPVERAPVRRSNTMPPNLGNAGILGKAVIEERVPGVQHSPLLYSILFHIMLYSILLCLLLAILFSILLINCDLLSSILFFSTSVVYSILFYFVLLGSILLC